MKVLLISNDTEIINEFRKTEVINENCLQIYRDKDLLNLMSFILNNHPSVVIVDDDLLKPNSSRVISSVKNIIPNITTIFIASDDSHKLGREISPLGVLYYGIKPLNLEDIKDVMKSLSRNKNLNKVN